MMWGGGAKGGENGRTCTGSVLQAVSEHSLKRRKYSQVFLLSKI